MSATSSLALSTPPAPSNDKEGLRRITSETVLDQQLVQRFVGGDEAAFLIIMEKYRGKILGVTLGLLRNHADAEEITQDTFIRAHRGLANFRGDSSLSTWLYRIAINLARNRYWYFHRRRRQDTFSLDSALNDGNTATFSDMVADVGNDPAQETIALEFSKVVDQCMLGLDQAHREILTLRNGLHQSYEEIATKLGINVGTVKSRIARARDTLRLRMADAFPEFSREVEPQEWFLTSRPTYGRPAIASS
ncbi:MAG: sigma-70 family RNA polymerase sigma factor [Opitutus sp.]